MDLSFKTHLEKFPYRPYIGDRGDYVDVSYMWGCGVVHIGDNVIKVQRNPFTWFGLVKIAPFEERLRQALDKIKILCADLQKRELEKIEFEDKWSK